MRTVRPLGRALLLFLAAHAHTIASDHAEFTVKREPVFEFAQRPTVTRAGDRITIAFETKGLCDVTIAVEDEKGRILRHLASGVLGPNAPAPFERNARKQTIVWDGKDDTGHYVDEKDRLTIRVSLGLRPRFERTLFWSPHKRFTGDTAVIRASADGVYVFEGENADWLRLYDHDGNYVRTIYPFPRATLPEVRGLEWRTCLQDGQKRPVTRGYAQATFLTSGPNGIDGEAGRAATTMAVCGDRIALAFLHLNRLTAASTTGGLPLHGPATGFIREWQQEKRYVGPTSAAFSPDGAALYLTGYTWSFKGRGGDRSQHGVYKVAYAEDRPAQVFVGEMTETGHGTDNTHFAVPISVACDAKGRVYVADYLNDRIQVYSAEGEYLKTIKADKPAKIQIHPRTQEIYVFSWWAGIIPRDLHGRVTDSAYDALRRKVPTLTRCGPLEHPAVKESWTLPLPGGGPPELELDLWTDPPRLWVALQRRTFTKAAIANMGVWHFDRYERTNPWARFGIRLFVQDRGAWVLRRDFATEASRTVKRLKPPDNAIQRLIVNPANRRLYVLEHLGARKCNDELVEVDPETGEVELVAMPFLAEDVCFDRNGLIYLRTDREVVRYSWRNWVQAPWDYGVERNRVSFSYGGRRADVTSALPLPGRRPMWFHAYGLWVNPRGHLAVSCVNRLGTTDLGSVNPFKQYVAENPTVYEPVLYTGRARHQEIHIWDEHGKILYEDAVPGLALHDGLCIDKDNNLYLLVDAVRVLDGAPYPNKQTETLMKIGPRQGRLIASCTNTKKLYAPFAPLPLPKDQWPKRPPDLVGGRSFARSLGNVWVDGAQWFYGGVGTHGAGCVCWHGRFQLDDFARSFAVEPDLYGVAVLDTNGNLILRLGRYGNVDDGAPLTAAGGPPTTRSVGGDEVALVHPAYLGVDTDRRLFIADIGNYRIVSVELGYAADERIRLRDIPDTAGPVGVTFSTRRPTPDTR